MDLQGHLVNVVQKELQVERELISEQVIIAE